MDAGARGTRPLSHLAVAAELGAQLRDLVASIRAREPGGFVCAFAGPSGTGKTMAVAAVAGELGAELFRVDVSRVVSKYIGETEKDLDRVFEEAEMAGAVLFFDGADALFGKRSQVKDAGDRYANMKIDYLLQRIVEHTGVVVIASDLRPALDAPFTRHLDRIVQFPPADRKEDQ